MPTALLKDRSVVLVSGPDAEHFLQNILTTDLDTLKEDEVRPGALLTPQGKILFDFLISRAGDNAFRLDCRTDVTDDFVRRLMLYRLRAKAEISKLDQTFVFADWDEDSSASRPDSASLADTRFADGAVRRRYGSTAKDGDIAAWHVRRINAGVAESGSDYELGD